MGFPDNRKYTERQYNRLKPGQFYCGECGTPVTGLSTTNANGKRVGPCCSPDEFKPVFAYQERGQDGRKIEAR